MARTRTNLRQLVQSQPALGGLISGTADSMTATTLTDSPLARFQDDDFLGMWVYLTSGSPSVDELYVTSSAQSGGVLTFIPSITGTGTLTYEILSYAPTDIHALLDESILHCYDEGWLGRKFWMHMVSGSPVYNSDWSYWTSATAVDGWTGSNATLGREQVSANVGPMPHALSMQRTSGGSVGTLALDALYRRYLYDMLDGTTITLYCWVLTSTASHARLQLVETSSAGVATTTSGSYHGGSGGWELLEVELSTTAGSVELYPQLEVADSANTAYFGPCWIEDGPPVEEYPFPVALAPDGPSVVHKTNMTLNTAGSLSDMIHGSGRGTVRGVELVKYHSEQAATEVGSLIIPRETALGGRALLLECDGPLSLPTANGDQIEVNQTESLLLAKLTALKLLEQEMRGLPRGQRRNRAEDIANLARDIGSLTQGKGFKLGAAPLAMMW